MILLAITVTKKLDHNKLTAKRGETGSYVYHYDKQGSLTEELCNGQKTTYHYDSLNRQTEVIKADGMFQRNRYDAEGLRAEMEENGRLCRVIFHKGEIVSEEKAEEQQPIRYIRGYGVEYLEQDGKSYSIQKDEQNSIVFLLNRNHEIEGSYSYNGFGGFRGQSDGQVKNRILYTGQQYDSLNSQYYLRARFYSPVLGRFQQEDPYRGDGLNLYVYCANNPVIYYDSSGYAKKKKDCLELGFSKGMEEMEGVEYPELYSKWNWSKPKSQPTYGHAYSEHGSHVTAQYLQTRATRKGHQIGQWTNQPEAAGFIAEIAKRGPGRYNENLPDNVTGRSFHPDPQIGEVSVDKALIIVRPNNSISSAYPYNSKYPTTNKGDK